MNTTRKGFLKQSALAVLSTSIPFSKIFSKDKFASKNTLDTYHPVDCSIDLATSYQYTYDKQHPDTSQITISDGYYSAPDGGSNTTNIFSDDVLYVLEGQFPDAGLCDPNPSTNQCNNYDFNPFNPPSYQGTNPFKYKVYYPKTTVHDYTEMPLPVYIFFHAGGFQECPAYTLPLINNLCIELSKKGFICFTVEYRRGRILDTDTTKTSVQQQFARYRAIQDGCGAIRSIIKKNRAGDPERFPFIIDESQVFVGGTSAGGIVAMGAAYYSTSADLTTYQTMIDLAFPKGSSTVNEIKDVLGNMHANYYYAPVDANYWPKIIGVASLWGGIVMPKSYDGASNEADLALVEATFFQLPNLVNNNPPLICFHGALDTTVPFYDGTGQDLDLSPPPMGISQNYNAENFCTASGGTFTQKAFSTSVELKMCSSLNMFLVMRRLNRFSEFYLDCSMAHGLDEDCVTCGTTPSRHKDDCSPCTYTSNFGTSATNQIQTAVYMAQRIAVFSQAIMASPTVLLFGAKGRPYFKDCENFRTCNGAESHACGTGGYTLCNGQSLY
jgi:acetyl esterase/lipase